MDDTIRQERGRRDSRDSGPLSTQELEEAKTNWTKYTQEQAYGSEKASLVAG